MPHPPPSVENNHHALSQSGTRVSGILHKWVNCGKGWRPRWFVLQDGVLSYYKIHSPVVIKEINEECRVIGSHSSHNHHHVDPRHHKPLGELHLKVSSICESKSDGRKFSIFTGTKGLHLKASTHEDQMEWMEALNVAKRMFPRMSNSELMNPVTNFTLSTELLRLRLLKEGVDEAIIQDAESIMRDEFSTMQDELVLLQKKVGALVDTLGIS